jgi:hypothetical protein
MMSREEISSAGTHLTIETPINTIETPVETIETHEIIPIDIDTPITIVKKRGRPAKKYQAAV